MVLPGQYLERPTLIARKLSDSSAITLEGLYHRGKAAPAVLICSPHPQLGGSMDSPVVAELAWAVSRSEHASLRFNYQGVGASAGEISRKFSGENWEGTPGVIDPEDFKSAPPISLSSLKSEREDAKAAAEHLRASLPHQHLVVAGYSFGAALALALVEELENVAGLALVAPPVSVFDFSPLKSIDLPLLVAWGQRDPWVDEARLKGLLAGRAWAEKVLPDADHSISRGLTELGRSVAQWVSGLG